MNQSKPCAINANNNALCSTFPLNCHDLALFIIIHCISHVQQKFTPFNFTLNYNQLSTHCSKPQKQIESVFLWKRMKLKLKTKMNFTWKGWFYPNELGSVCSNQLKSNIPKLNIKLMKCRKLYHSTIYFHFTVCTSFGYENNTLTHWNERIQIQMGIFQLKLNHWNGWRNRNEKEK